MDRSTTLGARYTEVQTRLAAAVQQAGRAPDSVSLLAVSKHKPASAIAELAAAGQHAFGENYLQEALPKLRALANCKLEWHFIGKIQSNKTRDIAASFSWVHTVDRLKIAERLASQRPADKPPLNICIEVNLSGEVSKGGISPDKVVPLAEQIDALPNLRLRGLMALPARSEDTFTQTQRLRPLVTLFKELNTAGWMLDTLSMGTTHDFETAIACGSTIVRIGTALFGQRDG